MVAERLRRAQLVALIPIPCQIPHPGGLRRGEGDPRDGLWGERGRGKVAGEWIRFGPTAPASHPPPPCAPAFPSSWKHRIRRVWERAPGGTRVCSVAIPHLLPWLLRCLFLRCFLVPAPAAPDSLFPEGCSSPPVLRRTFGCRGPGKDLPRGRRLSRGPRSRIPGAEEPASLGLSLVYVGEFCGLMACIHAARESKPNSGGRSISGDSIYAKD